MTTNLQLTDIRIDGGTQSRAGLNKDVVLDYTQAMQADAQFPAVTVYHDGKEYWLADGFHRIAAAQEAGLKEFPAEVQQGTRRDAVLASVGANGRHGLRRTNEDKRRAVTMLLEDAEWSKWSNSQIAKRCDVSLDLVNRMRTSSLNESLSDPTRTYTTKHGTTATMNTANIGHKPPAAPVRYSTDPDFNQDTPDAAPVEADMWYPVNLHERTVYLAPFDEDAVLDMYERYRGKDVNPMTGEIILSQATTRKWKYVDALPAANIDPETGEIPIDPALPLTPCEDCHTPVATRYKDLRRQRWLCQDCMDKQVASRKTEREQDDAWARRGMVYPAFHSGGRLIIYNDPFLVSLDCKTYYPDCQAVRAVGVPSRPFPLFAEYDVQPPSRRAAAPAAESPAIPDATIKLAGQDDSEEDDEMEEAAGDIADDETEDQGEDADQDQDVPFAEIALADLLPDKYYIQLSPINADGRSDIQRWVVVAGPFDSVAEGEVYRDKHGAEYERICATYDHGCSSHIPSGFSVQDTRDYDAKRRGLIAEDGKPSSQDDEGSTRGRWEAQGVANHQGVKQSLITRRTAQERLDASPAAPGTFRAILVDPPWQYTTYSEDTGQGRSAESHYPTMTLEEMCALPVGYLAAADCALFMWVTWPTIQQAFALGDKWGFTYKTCGFMWAKLKKGLDAASFITANRDDNWHMGMGFWSRANTEACLLFTKGEPPCLNHDVRQLIVSPLRKHSQKPNEIYPRIERLVAGPYLELFARQKREGWSAWGNEVESDINLGVPIGDAAPTSEVAAR